MHKPSVAATFTKRRRPKRAKWYQPVETARAEALNAVEFYNRPNGRRPLETYLVHMHLAWLHLLHAEFMRDGVNFYYRERKSPTRYVRIDGEKKTWDLSESVKFRWPDQGDAVRKNLDLTIKLRNKIEHRYEAGLQVASAGFCQSLLINFEEELITEFGAHFSLGTQVHIPISLGTYTREGSAALVAAQQGLPQRLKDFFIEFRSSLDDDTRSDRHFEVRVDLVQKRAPKSDADLAVSFVREDELSPEELLAYAELERTGRVIIHDKERPVANSDRYKPGVICEMVEAVIPYRFRASSEFPQAWKYYAVRPGTSVKGAAKKKTDPRYCVYDSAHDDYTYTTEFVALLVQDCGTEDGFFTVVGRRPTLKDVAVE